MEAAAKSNLKKVCGAISVFVLSRILFIFGWTLTRFRSSWAGNPHHWYSNRLIWSKVRSPFIAVPDTESEAMHHGSRRLGAHGQPVQHGSGLHLLKQAVCPVISVR